VDYQLRNLRSWPAFGLFLDAIHAHPHLRHVAEPASVDNLPGRNALLLRTVMQVGPRGRYLVPTPVAASSFPFGICRWSCADGEPQRLLVHPAFEPLQSLALPVSQRYQRETGSMIAKIGEAMEFHGCREYRNGDNPKHIHWPSTARAGIPIVREFQEEYLCRVAIVADTWQRPMPWWRRWPGIAKSDPAFEAALTVVAAAADFLARGDHVIDLFAAGPEVFHFRAGRGPARFNQLLDILAGLEPSRTVPPDLLAPSILEEIAEIGAAIVVLLGWDDARANLVRRLSDHGVGIKLVLTTATLPPGVPAEAIHLRPTEVLAGQVRNL